MSYKIVEQNNDFADIICECGNEVCVLFYSGGTCEKCKKEYFISSEVRECKK